MSAVSINVAYIATGLEVVKKREILDSSFDGRAGSISQYHTPQHQPPAIALNYRDTTSMGL
jgi:hypothetical protein